MSNLPNEAQKRLKKKMISDRAQNGQIMPTQAKKIIFYTAQNGLEGLEGK